MMDLRDKVAVITGASSGIGRAAAIEFARKGCIVVLAARRVERLEEVRNSILCFNERCISVPTDVTDEGQVVALFNRVEQELGQVDILINNAGRGLKSRVGDITGDQWRSVMDTNLTSVFFCTREAARRMTSCGGGHIITVCSIAGLFGAPGYSAYCASKHGVTGFCRAVKWELRKQGVRVSTIYPARVDTEFFDNYKERPASRQMLAAADIARHLVAIASRSRAAVLWSRIGNFVRRIRSVVGL